MRFHVSGTGPAFLLLAGLLATPAVPAALSRSDAGTATALLLGETAAERGQYAIAAAESLRAARRAANPRIAERAAQLAFENGQDQALVAAARRWLELDPGSEAARRHLAIGELRTGNLDAAQREFAGLIRNHSASPAAAFTALLEALGNERHESEAAQLMAGLAADFPDVPEAWYAQAALSLQAENSPQALVSVRRALQARPDWAEARWLEARALLAGGQTQSGLTLALQLTSLDDPASRLTYGWLLAAGDQEPAARGVFSDLAARGPGRAEALEALASLDLEAGDLVSAKARYTEVLGSGRSTDRAMLGLGAVAEREGDVLAAIRWYSKVTAGSRASAAQLRVYRLLQQQRQPDLAARHLDNFAIEAAEHRIPILAGRAQVLADTGRGADAVELLDRAIATYPDQETLRYSRAAVLEELGRVDEAIAALREVQRRRPADPVALNALAYTLADHSRQLQLAERLVRQAIAQKPDSMAVADSLGWVLYRRGAPADALPWLEKSYALGKDPEVAAHLGEVQWVLGQRAAAESLWRDALQKSPDSRHVREAMTRFLGKP